MQNERFIKQLKYNYEKKSYRQAFNQAQEIMIDHCLLTENEMDDVRTNMQYIYNWQGYTKYIDIQNDNIEIEVPSGKVFKFSKSKFLENRRFFGRIIYEYNNHLGNVYIRLKKSGDNNYTIRITKRH